MAGVVGRSGFIGALRGPALSRAKLNCRRVHAHFFVSVVFATPVDGSFSFTLFVLNGVYGGQWKDRPRPRYPTPCQRRATSELTGLACPNPYHFRIGVEGSTDIGACSHMMPSYRRFSSVLSFGCLGCCQLPVQACPHRAHPHDKAHISPYLTHDASESSGSLTDSWDSGHGSADSQSSPVRKPTRLARVVISPSPANPSLTRPRRRILIGTYEVGSPKDLDKQATQIVESNWLSHQ